MNKGRLILMPNTLDFGVDDSLDLREVLPQRVIEQAAKLTHWAAENAKTTRSLLKRVDAVAPLVQPLQTVQIAELPRPPKGGRGGGDDMAAWLALLDPAHAGHDLGLISEAGLPAVADPGARLVALAHEAGIEVVPLSGPSSLLLALAASGLNGQSFAFVGYLPVEASGRTARIRELEALSAKAQQTQLLIETPYRNEALRQALLATLKPGTRLSISVGLTLPGGWTQTATVADWRANRTTLPDRIPAVFALLA
ncbi:16S rRNA (cytidine1402-2'-O)-methyltransferase [Pelomonas saccharophila]|uniref:16S rRNA (Cytidine1402-2'-O)-methyltransferase n=1 Tax=Roseateles saccharophilus TaxID=304 RepID=A0ABU1YUH8_ROSSA|nr:SAM-dependent methyltransferase [Roseateles saccharophilus]MDR7271836.1 16S rRNA (cytidine1402-2'-O)-methyltransferase [Roseateles saccharophilus]